MFNTSLIKNYNTNLVYIVLSTILSPAAYFVYAEYFTVTEFGELNVLLVSIIIIENITQLGVSQAIVAKSDINLKRFKILAHANVSLGLSFSLITLTAVFFYDYLSGSELSYIYYVLAIFPYQKQLIVPYKAWLQKKLNFKSYVILDSIELVLKHGLSILLIVFIFPSKFLVVSSYAISYFFVYVYIKTIHHDLYQSFFSNFNYIYKYREIKEAYEFGVYVALKTLLNQLSANIDIYLISTFYGGEFLGNYSFAKRLVQEPKNKFSELVNRVNYPTFSKIFTKPIYFKKIYRKLKLSTLAVSFSLFILFLLVFPLLVEFIFGQKWSGAYIYIYILLFSVIYESISMPFSTSILYVYDESKYLFRFEMVFSLIRMAVLYLYCIIWAETTSFIIIVMSITFIKVMYLDYVAERKIFGYFKLLKYTASAIILYSLFIFYVI